MSEVWLLWDSGDSPVAAFASRASAEAAALVFARDLNRLRTLQGGVVHELKRNDFEDSSSFWLGNFNVASIARMEVQP